MSIITRISIPELMDGRYFYIPSYQRGYRWTKTQVAALLNDLFMYACSPHDHTQVKDGDYYCLQPIVARKIVNRYELSNLVDVKSIPENKEMWEIIDGQQRLTTIFILYLFLMKEKNMTVENLLRRKKKELYHLVYATRKDSSDYLEHIYSNQSNHIENIDFFHMQMAYDTINQWVYSEKDFAENGASALLNRYNLNDEPELAIDILWSLLNAQKGHISNYGTVQFLWYELDGGKDVIQEFRDTNMNQIHLTDAELIKALFLKTLNNVPTQNLLERANQWEYVENVLQDNTFWFFLNKRGYDLPNRIDFLFRIRYQVEQLKKAEEEKKNLQEPTLPTETKNGEPILSDEEINRIYGSCEKQLGEKDFLFHYFNLKFEGLEENELSIRINEEWQEILTIFRTLEDWYDDVICYNLIGMLSQFDNSKLPAYYYKFISMNENDSREEFKKCLKEEIANRFKNVKFVDGQLSLSYGDSLVFNLLLLLNINHLNKQATGVSSANRLGFIYKFPFDVLQNDWDIEHIDSFTTNPLRDDKDKEEWVNIAKEDLGIEDEKLSVCIENKNWGGAINRLKELAKEPEISEDAKNNISNLTLLDAETNRSYGNSLFVTKRKRIIERMKAGQYVPISTTYVFMKLFDEAGTSRSVWGEEDMRKYHDYICKELKDYLPQL